MKHADYLFQTLEDVLKQIYNMNVALHPFSEGVAYGNMLIPWPTS
jgi:hypothetical protein